MQRAAAYIYDGVKARPNLKYTVRATYLEIYNETVVDLVEPKQLPLPVRGSSKHGFYVEDLSVTHCRGLTDLEYVPKHWPLFPICHTPFPPYVRN